MSPIALRTSTLAALVVAGGTIAALPFRRFSADLDPETEATGPSPTDLAGRDMARHDPANQVGHRENYQAQGHSHPAMVTGPSSDQDPTISDVASRLTPPALNAWQPPSKAALSQRQIEMPLTFDDLMLPIDRPQPIAEQFTATVPSSSAVGSRRSQANARDRPESLNSPDRFETLHQDSAGHREPSLPPPVAGSFASSRIQTPDPHSRIGPQNSSDRPTPTAPPPVQRDRHWIRQPGSD